MANIFRAVSLFSLESAAKSYVDGGLPASPTWQNVQPTPSDRVKSFIVPRSCGPLISCGRNLRFLCGGFAKAGGAAPGGPVCAMATLTMNAAAAAHEAIAGNHNFMTVLLRRTAMRQRPLTPGLLP